MFDEIMTENFPNQKKGTTKDRKYTEYATR
jgi:hypothetical protein